MEQQLIEEVRKYPCLFDTTLEEYKHTDRKENAWRKIAVELSMNCEEVKKLWKKLRDCYRQALGRRKTASGQTTKNIKPWKYENQMEFLTPFFAVKPTFSNITVLEEEVDNAAPDSRCNLTNEEEEFNISVVEHMNEKRKEPSKRKAEPGDIEKVLTFLKEKRKGKPDDLDYFFASACASTRCLPRRIQSDIKREILNIICKAEERHERETVNSLSVPSPTLSCSQSSSSVG